MPAVIPLVIAAGQAVASKAAADKQARAQRDAAAASQVNVGQIGQQTADQARQNAIASADLEKQLTPEVPLLRQQANQALLNGGGQSDADVTRGKGLVAQSLGVPTNSPLLQSAIAKAQADLNLGGGLDQDTQNLVTRKGLATAGTVGGGLGLGRDVVARDLGLTGLQVQQQRLQNASQLGGQELGANQWNASHLLDSVNLLNGISTNDFQKKLALAQYGQSIRQPVVGLDPGSAANLTIANQNAAGQGIANSAATSAAGTNAIINGVGQVYGAYQAYKAPPPAYNPYSYTPQPTYTPASSPTGYTTPGGYAGVQTTGFFQ